MEGCHVSLAADQEPQGDLRKNAEPGDCEFREKHEL